MTARRERKERPDGWRLLKGRERSTALAKGLRVLTGEVSRVAFERDILRNELVALRVDVAEIAARVGAENGETILHAVDRLLAEREALLAELASQEPPPSDEEG